MKGGRTKSGKQSEAPPACLRPPFVLPPLARARPALLLALLPTLLLALVLAAPAQAQDSTRTPADTLRSALGVPTSDSLATDSLATDSLATDSLATDSLATDSLTAQVLAADTLERRRLTKAEVLTLDEPRTGRAVTGRLPTRDPALDATDLLARVPGTYRYDLGGVGWPHGVSFRARSPDATALTLGGLPFDDPLTGRPRYDLLPLPFLAPLYVDDGPSVLGGPGRVEARLRPYDVGRPLTTLRYRSGGLHSIGALHTQQRKVRFFGQPAFAQFTGGYFGRGSNNVDVLPGSRLSTERRLLGRVRYRRRTWAAELTALHNRRRIGANGGVALDTLLTETAFLPTRTVRFPEAERRLLRTDLAATLRLRAPFSGVLGDSLPAGPLTATVYRTSQTHRYRNPVLADSLGLETTENDTLAAETVRLGLRLRLPLTLRTERFGRHALALEAHAWRDGAGSGNALAGQQSRTQLHLSVRDSTRLLGADALLRAGLHAGPVQTYPAAGVRLARDALGGRARVFAEAGLSGQPVSRIEAQGFGPPADPLVRPLSGERTPGAVLSAEAGARGRLGPVQARLALFADRTAGRLLLRATRPATVQAVAEEGVSRRAGATLGARWRAAAARGFYATAAGTAYLEAAAFPFQENTAPTVPQAHARGRLGARYAFFTADLGVDAYVEGRFWSRTTSRALHAPTGRLVLPPPGSPVLGPSGVLDVHVEAQIRTATLFFSYENALSETQVQAGVLGASVYPLPAQRFRFGVYWPISN